MKWIVGLGNPGSRYARTRHNVGFMALDQLAEKLGITFGRSKFDAELAEGKWGDEKIFLLKPLTFMNLSGNSIRAFMDFYKADVGDFILIYDDLDTKLGQIRLRYQGGSGGHNGLKSTIQHLGTERFNRIRIGISRPELGWDIVDYVLAEFTKEEKQTVEQVLDLTVDAALFTLEEPFEKAMAKFNG